MLKSDKQCVSGHDCHDTLGAVQLAGSDALRSVGRYYAAGNGAGWGYGEGAAGNVSYLIVDISSLPADYLAGRDVHIAAKDPEACRVVCNSFDVPSSIKVGYAETASILDQDELVAERTTVGLGRAYDGDVLLG